VESVSAKTCLYETHNSMPLICHGNTYLPFRILDQKRIMDIYHLSIGYPARDRSRKCNRVRRSVADPLLGFDPINNLLPFPGFDPTDDPMPVSFHRWPYVPNFLSLAAWIWVPQRDVHSIQYEILRLLRDEDGFQTEYVAQPCGVKIDGYMAATIHPGSFIR
jgi:hypothetical protein